MATQVDESTVKLNPGVVGIAFAEQYYNTLSKSPELLHNFYNDSSLIGRPGLDGSVSSASTLEVSLLLGASSGVCCIFKSPSVELEFSPYLLMLNVGCYNWVNPGWLAIYLCIVRVRDNVLVWAAIQKSLEELFLLGALTDDCKLSEGIKWLGFP
ncbi:hypothetical protein NC652_036332 [Populus alba x Populus x berolinensis]|nr:hypothetical protein NC652_036332 [Populus alba x Populus x berolinensis]